MDNGSSGRLGSPVAVEGCAVGSEVGSAVGPPVVGSAVGSPVAVDGCAVEDMERAARRMYGTAHPMIRRMEAELRNARATLRARETPSTEAS